MFGKLLSNNQELAEIGIGKARHATTGMEYQLSIDLLKGSPIIRSEKTGRVFILTWSDVVDLAIAIGIDDQPASPQAEPPPLT